MKTVLFFTVSIVLSLSCYSQNKFANNWLFGVNAGITFNTTPPSALPVSKVNTDMQTSSISDKEGNLLFYSDGYSVWNRNHEIMPNGNLNPISFNPLTLAMLRPYSPNSYFLLSMQSNCVNIYLVDMSLNNGLGDISSFGFFF